MSEANGRGGARIPQGRNERATNPYISLGGLQSEMEGKKVKSKRRETILLPGYVYGNPFGERDQCRAAVGSAFWNNETKREGGGKVSFGEGSERGIVKVKKISTSEEGRSQFLGSSHGEKDKTYMTGEGESWALGRKESFDNILPSNSSSREVEQKKGKLGLCLYKKESIWRERQLRQTKRGGPKSVARGGLNVLYVKGFTNQIRQVPIC